MQLKNTTKENNNKKEGGIWGWVGFNFEQVIYKGEKYIRHHIIIRYLEPVNVIYFCCLNMLK